MPGYQVRFQRIGAAGGADLMQAWDFGAHCVPEISCGFGQSLPAPLLDCSPYRGRWLHHWRLPQ